LQVRWRGTDCRHLRPGTRRRSHAREGALGTARRHPPV